MAEQPDIESASGHLGTEESHGSLPRVVIRTDTHAAACEPVICFDIAEGLPITVAELDVIERYFTDLIDAALGR